MSSNNLLGSRLSRNAVDFVQNLSDCSPALAMAGPLGLVLTGDEPAIEFLERLAADGDWYSAPLAASRVLDVICPVWSGERRTVASEAGADSVLPGTGAGDVYETELAGRHWVLDRLAHCRESFLFPTQTGIALTATPSALAWLERETEAEVTVAARQARELLTVVRRVSIDPRSELESIEPFGSKSWSRFCRACIKRYADVQMVGSTIFAEARRESLVPSLWEAAPSKGRPSIAAKVIVAAGCFALIMLLWVSVEIHTRPIGASAMPEPMPLPPSMPQATVIQPVNPTYVGPAPEPQASVGTSPRGLTKAAASKTRARE